MSKFKPGDRVRHKRNHSITATIMGIYEDLYWVKYDNDSPPITKPSRYYDSHFELIPEPFVRDGADRYYNYYSNGVVGTVYPSLSEAENVLKAPNNLWVGIIRVDGQTGALTWVKGGPK